MAYQNIDGVRVWGKPDDGALVQARRCAENGNVVQTLLMADHHKGYSQPIGGGNHFVDLLEESGNGRVWVANHFGSRGFGHKTASGFLNLAAGRDFLANAPG